MSAVTLAGKEPTALSVYPKLDAVSKLHYQHVVYIGTCNITTYVCIKPSTCMYAWFHSDSVGGYCEEAGECFCNFGYAGQNCDIGKTTVCMGSD